MNNDLVTIVVPVYNVEKYIERCLNSIIGQTYNNLEILVVNDGTEDKSMEICKRIQLKVSRIKIINQKTAGLSAARNTGIRNASGKYICFIDSDDFVNKEYVRLLLNSLIENDTDISVCDFLYINEKGYTWSKKVKKNTVYSSIEAIRDLLVGIQNTEIMTWNKMYKLNLFKDNNIYFPEGKLHEDNFTTYKLYYYSRSISMIQNKLYYYLQRNNSIMGKNFNTRRMDILQAIKETKEFFKEKNVNLDMELECYEAIIKINILNNMITDNFYGEEKNKIINDIKNNKRKFIKNKYINKKVKLLIFLVTGKCRVYNKMLLLKNKFKKDNI